MSFAEKAFSREKRLAKALDYTLYSAKSSLHVMQRKLKASHMCAIVQCHKASLCTCARTYHCTTAARMGLCAREKKTRLNFDLLSDLAVPTVTV